MISILVPTRKRPQNLIRLITSAQLNADDPLDIEYVFYVDDDDDTWPYEIQLYSANIKKIKGERIVLSQMWNECYKVATGPIYMHCGDDIVFRTKHWDTLIKQEFDRYPDKIVFVCGRDDSPHDGIFGTHGFIHKNWVDTVGYFVPPYFSCDYNDTWLNDVARRLDRWVFVNDILTEHMHPDNSKAELDETHHERMERGARDNVQAMYNDMADLREKDAEKLREFIRNYK